MYVSYDFIFNNKCVCCQPVPPTQIMQAINLKLFYSFVRHIKNMSKYDKSELELIPTTFGN